MNTSTVVERPGRRPHRRHSAEFKAEIVRSCREPGVSMAAVALANGLNANMLRRWVAEAERAGAMTLSSQRTVGVNATAGALGLPGFVAVQVASSPAASAQPDIHIELTRGSTTVVVRWPASVADACAAWLREMLR